MRRSGFVVIFIFTDFYHDAVVFPTSISQEVRDENYSKRPEQGEDSQNW